MSIVKAIARVRKGARDRGLGGALASLGSELRSDAIPARLRDAAGRLATLISPKGTPPQAAPASLERALEAKAALSVSTAHADGARAEGVCPFTGMRADSDVAAAHAAEAHASGSTGPDLPLTASPHDATLELPLAAPAVAESPEVPSDDAAGGRARKPRARRNDVLHPRPERSEAAVREAPARKSSRREKSKEGLAGAGTVENTSGRSATRSASKQPRGRAPASRKKV